MCQKGPSGVYPRAHSEEEGNLLRFTPTHPGISINICILQCHRSVTLGVSHMRLRFSERGTTTLLSVKLLTVSEPSSEAPFEAFWTAG